MKKSFSIGLLLTLFAVIQSYGQDPLTNHTWTSADENSFRVVVTGTDPFGNQSSLLEVTPNGSWTGYRFQNVTVDPNKSYRFSYWTKVTSDTPSYTFTGKVETSSGLLSSSGSAMSDYYVHSGWSAPGTGTWYLYVGFIKGNSDSNTYNGSIQTTAGLESNLTTDGIQFASGTTSVTWGASWNSADSSNKIYLYDFRIEEVSNGDDSVTDLINPSGGNNGGNSGGGTGGYWTQTGSDIHYDGGNVGIGTTTPEEQLQISNSFLFHVGGHDVLGIRYKPTGGVDYDATKYGAEIRFDPVNGDLRLGTSPTLTTKPSTRLLISKDGNIGIGTSNPGSWKLAVNGNIRAKEIKVETGWADYVFKKGYDLPSLEEVEKHIHEKGHLMNIPSEAEVLENGIQLGEMNKLLLEKIEELTLYILEQEKKSKRLEDRIKALENTQINE